MEGLLLVSDRTVKGISLVDDMLDASHDTTGPNGAILEYVHSWRMSSSKWGGNAADAVDVMDPWPRIKREVGVMDAWPSVLEVKKELMDRWCAQLWAQKVRRSVLYLNLPTPLLQHSWMARPSFLHTRHCQTQMQTSVPHHFSTPRNSPCSLGSTLKQSSGAEDERKGSALLDGQQLAGREDAVAVRRVLMDASAPEDRGDDTKRFGETVSQRRRRLPRKHRVDCDATDASNDTYEKSKDKESTEYELEVLERARTRCSISGKPHRQYKGNSNPLAVIQMCQRFPLPAHTRSAWMESATTA